MSSRTCADLAVYAAIVAVIGLLIGTGAWLERRAQQMPDPADAQAIQDADDEACALTQPEPARAVDPDHQPFSDAVWQELVNGFAADAYGYRGGLGLPGETRTNWTREDYKS